MTVFHDDEQRYQVLARLSLTALYVLMGADAAIVLAGYLIDSAMARSIATEPIVVRNILFILAVSELAAMHFVKRSALARIAPRGIVISEKGKDLPYGALLNLTLVITAMCSAISIYGLVALILGARFEVLLLFVAISLVGYQLFRLRPRDFESR